MVEPGTVFAGYTVHRRIGAGGMGTVYLARHPRLPIDVALKVLDPTLGRTPQDRARFEREADIAARMRHPNIVPVHDRGAEGDYLWIVMDYVDGCDAAQLLERGPLAPAAAIDIVTQAADALDHAHSHRVLHRDIKPANLLIATVNHRKHVYLSDFGISRLMDDTASATAVRASFAYAAPELLTGHPLDERADLYSLGATLYHLLTGRVPFPRTSLAAVMHAHLTEPPPPLTTHRPDLPAALDEVLRRALAKSPADRYESGRALAVAARMALRGTNFPSHHTETELADRPDENRVCGGPSDAGSEALHDAGSRGAAGESARHSTGDAPAAGFGAGAGPLDEARNARGAIGADDGWAAAPDEDPYSLRPHPHSPHHISSRRRAILAGAAAGTLIVVALALALVGYFATRASYYVGTDNGRVVIYRGAPDTAFGFLTRDVEQVACATRAGDVQVAAPGTTFPSGCRELSVADLTASARTSVQQGFPAGSYDEAVAQLRTLAARDLLPPCETAAAPPGTTTTPPSVTAPPLGPASATGQNCRVSE